jgi:diguanylate cyclase (GGDEF)-like protein
MDGLELSRALRATEWGRNVYIFMLTGMASQEDLVHAYEAGVDEYVTKPINILAMQARLRAAARFVQLQLEWEDNRAQLKQFASELAIANRRLEQVALTDALTGLCNRRAAMELLGQAWSAATRNDTPLSVMIIDIDHFKRINDRYGHATGDQALREVAAALRGAARREDGLCRIGGEEFLVICQHADTQAALNSAERLRHTIEELVIQAADAPIRASVSIGVARKEAGAKDPDALVGAADKALYAAKEQGRNRVCLFDGGV